jgi:hypothetical protein
MSTGVINRNEIITKLSREWQHEVGKAVKNINERLTATVSLPVTIPRADLPKSKIGFENVLNVIKAAGWRCDVTEEEVVIQ